MLIIPFADNCFCELRKTLSFDIMNISSIPKTECCGCTACESTCPTKAISMQADYEGFLYPSINRGKCINCGKCINVCKNVHFNDEPQHIYACWSHEDSLRLKSSSGGVFSLLAERQIKMGGVVCAVSYSDDFLECKHKLVYNLEGIDDLRRAKFVQSKKYDVYLRIKKLLNEGEQVLFCGTPCEVGGLKQYLINDYENLLTCDIICGCTSSPEVYKTYIEYLSNKYESKVVGVNFKDKRAGWRGKAIAVEFENGAEYYNSILDDDYCVSFHSRYNIRPSCFNCKYRSLKRVSDFTLGDFWGIEKYDPSLDDNRGTSFVLTNTATAEKVIRSLDMNIKQMDIDYEAYCINNNWCMHRNPYPMPEKDRKTFYEDVKTMPFNQMALKDLEIIKQERKRKKIENKQVRYE